jgi:hypothetical protein
MSISLITTIDCLALFLFLYTFFAFRDHRRRRGLPYPPGPPSLPLIGNLLDVPKLAPWLAYANMSKKYGRIYKFSLCRFSKFMFTVLSGDVVCLEVFGQVVVVLSSLTAIKDLVEKRGELYADRTPFPIFEMFAIPWFYLALANGAIIVPGWIWRGCFRSPERENTGVKAEGC